MTVQVFTSSGLWTKPKTGTWAEITLIGAGAGGGSGRRGFPAYAGGPGGGGAVTTISLPLAALGKTEMVTVGGGGSGGPSIGTDNTDGLPGEQGGDSSFGSWAVASGGFYGYGGTSTDGTPGLGGLLGTHKGGTGPSALHPVNFEGDTAGAGGGGSGMPLFSNHTRTVGDGITGHSPGGYLPGFGGSSGISGKGGNGGLYGGGGGGGYPSSNGTPSGAGGNGAQGIVIIKIT